MNDIHVRSALAALVVVGCFVTASPIGAAPIRLPPEEVARIVEDQVGGIRLEGEGIDLGVDIRHVEGAEQLVVTVFSERTVSFAQLAPGDQLAFSTRNSGLQGVISISDDGEIATVQSISYREGELVSSRWFRVSTISSVDGPKDRN